MLHIAIHYSFTETELSLRVRFPVRHQGQSICLLFPLAFPPQHILTPVDAASFLTLPHSQIVYRARRSFFCLITGVARLPTRHTQSPETTNIMYKCYVISLVYLYQRKLKMKSWLDFVSTVELEKKRKFQLIQPFVIIVHK